MRQLWQLFFSLITTLLSQIKFSKYEILNYSQTFLLVFFNWFLWIYKAKGNTPQLFEPFRRQIYWNFNTLDLTKDPIDRGMRIIYNRLNANDWLLLIVYLDAFQCRIFEKKSRRSKLFCFSRHPQHINTIHLLGWNINIIYVFVSSFNLLSIKCWVTKSIITEVWL